MPDYLARRSDPAHHDPLLQTGAFRNTFIAIGASVVFAVGYLWIAFGSIQTPIGEPAALVFPPHWPPERALHSALSLDLALVDFGEVSNIAVVVPYTDTALDTARSKGAMLILNAAGAAICATTF